MAVYNEAVREKISEYWTRLVDEKTTWDYYNLIREIECTNRTRKCRSGYAF